MRQPNVVMLDPKKLRPYEKNPRKNENAIMEVARSIEMFGFNNPILIDQKNRICCGHTRREAAISLGLKSVPCIKKKMTEQEFIAFNIADNKTGELAQWDEPALAALLQELDESEALDVPGFTQDELDKLLLDNQLDDDEGPSGSSKRSSSETTKLVYNCTAKQAKEIDSKLDIIIRENKFDNQVEALLFALKGFKGPTKVKVVKRS